MSIHWRNKLKQNFYKWEPLADFLMLSVEQREQILKKTHFPLNLPLRLAEKMEKGTLDDPLLKQFLPLQVERQDRLGFVSDPVGDSKVRCASKLLQKYEGRVLILCTSACAMNCRFCFRQNFDYETEVKGFEEEVASIANDPTIHEVILSGGDPLALSDSVLKKLFNDLAEIPHVKRLRFHTRFPIGIPERIDEGFLSLLKESRLSFWFLVHINHPRELDREVLEHLGRIQQLGIPVMTQTVLLKDINDNPDTLIELFETLVDHQIIPYYLHQLDRVKGAGHFEVSEEKGKELIKQISLKLSGYAVPRYVREVSGEPYKVKIL